MTSGRYMPTEVRDQGVADKLGIPTAYLRRLHLHRSGCTTRSERVAGRSPAEVPGPPACARQPDLVKAWRVARWH